MALGLGVQPARALDPVEAAVLHRIDAARERAGCPPLRVGARVSSRAGDHSVRMARAGRVYHSDLGRTLAGVRWRLAAENVGAVEATGTAWSVSGAIHRAFMGSPVHRRNVLDCRYLRVGIGAVEAEGAWWVTEVLWR